INDPEWKAKRDVDWPVFETWLVERYTSDEHRRLDESLARSKAFYDAGIIEILPPEFGFKNVGFYEALALHPKLSALALREIMSLSCYRNSSLKGAFYQRYLLKPRYVALIDKKVLPQDFI